MRTFDLERLIWPWDRLAEAIALVAREYDLGDGRQTSRVGSTSEDVEAMAAAEGVEAERLPLSYRDIETTLATSAPMLIRAPLDGDGFVVILRNVRRASVLADPQGQAVQIPRKALALVFRRAVEKTRGAGLQRFLEHVQSESGGDDLARRLIAERYGDDEVGEGWLLRRSPHEGFWRHLSDTGAGVSAVSLGAVHFFRYAIFVLGWFVIGRVTIEGKPDGAWLIAWVLLLLMLVPIHYVATSLQGILAVACGFVLRQRLVYGSLRLDSERLRTDGAGHHLARVFEGDAVEALGRSGGLLAFFALIELALSAAILAHGAGGTLHVVLLGAWVAFVIVITIICHQRYEGWSVERLSLTADLVERMVGHRTRLVQERRSKWHDGEDVQLERYAHASRDLDRGLVWVSAVISRGWVAMALAGLAPSIVGGETPATAMAISLGGIVLAQQAMKRLSTGLPDLIAAVSAWKKVAPLLEAASQPQERQALVGDRSASGNRNVVNAQSIVFRYPHRAEPVLRGCTLLIQRGERVVLEGRSGSGKSTLASLLAGALSPDSGLLMLDGLDRATLGSSGWRQRAVLAPQFHENHVLSESFAFNLLMGRAWPPKPEDWREAEEVCVDLGLGTLLEQMPGGLAQMVGETGWRLSHGEQSRLFIARALLQKSELVVLDESFAALDPQTLQRSIGCVMRRAPALVVIAHP